MLTLPPTEPFIGLHVCPAMFAKYLRFTDKADVSHLYMLFALLAPLIHPSLDFPRSKTWSSSPTKDPISPQSRENVYRMSLEVVQMYSVVCLATVRYTHLGVDVHLFTETLRIVHMYQAAL